MRSDLATKATRNSLQQLEKMLTIRRVEENLIRLGHQGLIDGLYFVSIGQEAVAVGVCTHLRAGDVIFSTHRNHAHLLARGVAPDLLIAEVLGREGGTNGGRAGGYHPSAPELGIPHTSAIVGSSLPLAAGVALAKMRKNEDSIAVAFVGDGVFEQGVTYETLNTAKLLGLPLLIVCENNSVVGSGNSSSASTNLSMKRVEDVPRSFQIPTRNVDGVDIAQVSSVAKRLIDSARSGKGPAFMEAFIHKWPGNQGRYPKQYDQDTDLSLAWDGATPVEELREWSNAGDPVIFETRRLVREGNMRADELSALAKRVREDVLKAVDTALASPFPDPKSALKGVFADERG